MNDKRKELQLKCSSNASKVKPRSCYEKQKPGSNVVFVRNVEIPLVRQKDDNKCKTKNISAPKKVPVQTKNYDPTDFEIPEFLTTKRVRKEMEKLESLTYMPETGKATPSFNLNFHPDDILYPSLVNLNITDGCTHSRDIKTTAVKPTLKKDPEPDLAHYQEQDNFTDFCFYFKGQPPPPKKSHIFNGRELYRKYKNFN